MALLDTHFEESGVMDIFLIKDDVVVQVPDLTGLSSSRFLDEFLNLHRYIRELSTINSVIH